MKLEILTIKLNSMRSTPAALDVDKEYFAKVVSRVEISSTRKAGE